MNSLGYLFLIIAMSSPASAYSTKHIKDDLLNTINLYMSQARRTESFTEIVSLNLTNILLIGLGAVILGVTTGVGVFDTTRSFGSSRSIDLMDIVLLSRTALTITSDSEEAKVCLWRLVCDNKDSGRKFVSVVQTARNFLDKRLNIRSSMVDEQLQALEDVLRMKNDYCSMFKCHPRKSIGKMLSQLAYGY